MEEHDSRDVLEVSQSKSATAIKLHTSQDKKVHEPDVQPEDSVSQVGSIKSMASSKAKAMLSAKAKALIALQEIELQELK